MLPMGCYKTGLCKLFERLTSFLKVYACTTRFRWCARCTRLDCGCTAVVPFLLEFPELLTAVARRPVHP